MRPFCKEPTGSIFSIEAGSWGFGAVLWMATGKNRLTALLPVQHAGYKDELLLDFILF